MTSLINTKIKSYIIIPSCKVVNSIPGLNHNKTILGESLLISSLPGKAMRTLVDIARLAKQFNMRSQSRAW